MIQSCNKNETYLIDITSNLSQFLLHALYIYIQRTLSKADTLGTRFNVRFRELSALERVLSK